MFLLSFTGQAVLAQTWAAVIQGCSKLVYGEHFIFVRGIVRKYLGTVLKEYNQSEKLVSWLIPSFSETSVEAH